MSAIQRQTGNWYPILKPIIESNNFKELKKQLRKDMEDKSVYPEGHNIFRAFTLCPIEEVKIIILGQEPYCDGKATGLAFANNNENMLISPSLTMIKKELTTSIHGHILPFNHGLEHWAEQGVLLLNTALTVKSNQPGSHLDMWGDFINSFLHEFSRKRRNIIYMLWGPEAQKFAELDVIDVDNNYILKAPHPRGDAFKTNTKETFIGCDHFNQANKIIKESNKNQIEWLLTGNQTKWINNNNNIKDNYDEFE